MRDRTGLYRNYNDKLEHGQWNVVFENIAKMDGLFQPHHWAGLRGLFRRNKGRGFIGSDTPSKATGDCGGFYGYTTRKWREILGGSYFSRKRTSI